MPLKFELFFWGELFVGDVFLFNGVCCVFGSKLEISKLLRSDQAMQQVFLVYVFDVRLCWHWLWCSWNGGSTAFAPAALEPRMSLCPIIRWKSLAQVMLVSRVLV